jgi:PadR family transcriptional regulator PadR
LAGRESSGAAGTFQIAGPSKATVHSTVDIGDWTSQLRRGVLELCLLRLLERAPSYGYEIVTALAARRSLAAGENTIYPLLRRLRSDGLLAAFSQASPAGPPRQYYRLTPAGRRRLEALTDEWQAMAAAVQAFLGENTT